MAITVIRDRSGAMKHLVRIRQHSLVVDEAPAQGGADAGPDPHDLYDTALGACKALTMLWYAQRKGIALEDITVRVERDDADERRGTYRLRALIAVTGPLSDAQRRELLSVAGKCPIHKLMTQVTTEVETAWA